MPAFHHAGGDKGDEEAVCRHPSREAFVMECLSSTQASPQTPRSWVKAHPPPALPGAGGGGGERSSAAKAAQILKLVGLGVVLAIGVLFVLELMLFMAMLVHPLVNLLLEMTATLRMVDSLAGQDLTINTAIEMGRVSIRASGVEMAMAAPPPAEVAEAAGEAAAAEEPTAFVRWCEQSSCRAGFDAGVTCEQVDRDLQTGEDAEGNPVLPMPAPFCGAVHALNDAACLCDPTYTEQVPGVGQMVEMITLIGPMCSFEPKAPAVGNCP